MLKSKISKSLKNRFSNTFFLFSIAVLFLFLLSDFVAAQKPVTLRRAAVGKAVIEEAEKLLAERGYWITKVDGVKEASTYHALVAFQKVEGRKRTGVLTEIELTALRNSARPAANFSIGTAHIEIDLRRQVLFLVDENNLVTRILPVSSGSGKRYFDEGKWQIAVTPLGVFQITRQIKATRHAPLGTLFHPNYYLGGIAVHGSDSIPFRPASHGCVRIPHFASTEFSDLVWVGMPVHVF